MIHCGIAEPRNILQNDVRGLSVSTCPQTPIPIHFHPFRCFRLGILEADMRSVSVSRTYGLAV